MRLAEAIYSVFGESLDFGFRDQICRSAVSVPSNIAEGYDRRSNREFIRFLRIAMGSAAKLRTQLYLAQKLQKMDHSKASELLETTRKISAQLHKLIQTRLDRFQ